MSTKYLITGGAGHLGNVLVRSLLKQRKQVCVLALPKDKTAEQLPPEVELIRGNVCDPASLLPFFRGRDTHSLTVIHAAGIVTIASKFDQAVYDVNVNGTKNILRLCQEFGVKKLVYVSSVHGIPELPTGQIITEAQKLNPDHVTGLYAKTKAEAANLVLAASGRGLNASVVYPSGISGPYDYGRGHLTQLMIDYYKGRLTAGIKGGYDFVDVRDVANGILSCCEKGRTGEGYILSNRYFSIQELLALFHQVTGRRKIKTTLPMWFAKGTAPLSEAYYKLLRQPPLYTAYSLYTLSSNALFSHEKADRELGYKTRPFEQTIADTVAWLKTQGRI